MEFPASYAPASGLKAHFSYIKALLSEPLPVTRSLWLSVLSRRPGNCITDRITSFQKNDV
jgi:hypothetical protein